MKIETHNTTLVYDLVNHMREKGMPDEMAGYLRLLLDDNIPMNIIISNELYEVPWRYWNSFIKAHSDCCGTCNDETLFEVDRAQKELLQHATRLNKYALKF